MPTHIPLKRSECPICLADLNRASNAEGGVTQAPAPGDYSVCWSCGTILRFDRDLLLEIASEDRLDAELEPNQQRILRSISALRKKAAQDRLNRARPLRYPGSR